jgi:autophagy-related protein 11
LLTPFVDTLQVLSDVEEYIQTVDDSEAALTTLREIKNNLEKLVQKMDSLESNFDRIAERTRKQHMLLCALILSHHSL